jgi:general secretion pathway protein M
MMALALPWWRDRSPREQIMLAIMAGLLIIVTLWLGIVRPLAVAGDRAAARHATAIADLGEVRRMTIAIRAAEARRRGRADTPLLDRVRASASAAGLTPDALESSNITEVSMRITAIKPVALLRWIASLEEQDGITPTRLASRRNTDQTLAVTIILAEGGR